MLETLKKEDWAPYVGDKFLLEASASGPLELVLKEVSGYGRDRGIKREAYSLVFQGPQSSLLPQGIFSLAHTKMGSLEIFLVPIGRDADGVQYEAVFN